MNSPVKWLFILSFFLFLIFFERILYHQNNSSNQSVLNSSAPLPTYITKDSTIYPDPTYTPGDVFPGVSVQEICTRGYTKRVRNVPIEEKDLYMKNMLYLILNPEVCMKLITLFRLS